MTRLERSLVLVAVFLTTAACVGWYASVPGGLPATRPPIGPANDGVVAPSEPIDIAARRVVETDPFRLDRKAASVAYRPDLEGLAPLPKPPKPLLVLNGIVGPTALLDGVPGQSGTAIVHVGDTLGGLRIRRVGRDTVVVTGADTIWRLTLRQTWQ